MVHHLQRQTVKWLQVCIDIRHYIIYIYIYSVCRHMVGMLMFSYCLYFVQTALASTNELRMMIDAIPNEKTGLDNLNIEVNMCHDIKDCHPPL